MNKKFFTEPTRYQAPEFMFLEYAVESLFCLSDGVSVDDLSEVEEKW